jgi:hypothetical protein
VTKVVVPALYKYMAAKFAHALVERGEVRVGTLFDFRKSELHGERIVDVEEGVYKYAMDVDDVISPENQPRFLEGAIMAGPKGKIPVEGLTVRRRHSSTDCYVYCMTDRTHRDPTRAFGDEYRRCVQITDMRFFEVLTEFLACKHVGVFPCRYASRDRPHEYWRRERVPAALVKPTSYSAQHEVRAIWIPNAPPIAPVIGTCSDLPKYCSLLEP